MRNPLAICTLTALVTTLLSASLGAGELDPSQQNWFKHYHKQDNVPDPAKMLVNSGPEPALEEGFVPMFNGQDLAGWSSHGGESPFEAKDGCIIATCKPGSPSTYLCTKKSDYGDFIFTVEMKWEVEVNSGVMFRSRLKGNDNNTVYGPQAEMEPFSQDREWSGGIYGQSCGGWYYPLWLVAHKKVREAQVKEGWNRLTIQAKGDTVKTWLNGVPAAHWKTTEYLKGCFGLQMHKGKEGRVLWRNMKIKEL